MLISIKSRLIAGFALFALMLTGVGAFGYYGLSTLGERIEALYASNTTPLIRVASVRAHSLRIRMNLWRAQVEASPQATAQAEKDIAASRAAIEDAWARYYPDGITSPRERELATQINAALKEILPENDKVLALLRAEDYVAAKEYQDANVAVQADRLNELIDKAINDNAAQAEAAVKESSGITKTILVMAALLIAAGILLSLVIATLLTRGVKKPLDKALHTAADVFKGKLGQPIVVDTQGEFGRAIDALNLMDEKLSTTAEEGSRQAGEVGASMQEVISVINKMSDIFGEIAATSDKRSRGVAQSHVAISQIDAATQQNAALAEEAGAASQSLQEQARRMKQDMMLFRLANDTGAITVPRATVPKAGARVVKKVAKTNVMNPSGQFALAAQEGKSGHDDWQTF
ncbi:MCP four helix bundle domain-containing protein [Cupriavidus metallidurans]|uniref:MCP four helix bundle domain-containing protein n=1 Tax=Cupriavidus metallidurans TaxID=119219 RepID=UPI001E28444A|nr:MCP four helix bundle domain-containing protein [Cupriavidus metallidurans]